jgi:hypothetical protein
MTARHSAAAAPLLGRHGSMPPTAGLRRPLSQRWRGASAVGRAASRGQRRTLPWPPPGPRLHSVLRVFLLSFSQIVQHFTELDLRITSARISSDGGWFVDGELPFRFPAAHSACPSIAACGGGGIQPGVCEGGDGWLCAASAGVQQRGCSASWL